MFPCLWIDCLRHWNISSMWTRILISSQQRPLYLEQWLVLTVFSVYLWVKHMIEEEFLMWQRRICRRLESPVPRWGLSQRKIYLICFEILSSQHCKLVFPFECLKGTSNPKWTLNLPPLKLAFLLSPSMQVKNWSHSWGLLLPLPHKIS